MTKSTGRGLYNAQKGELSLQCVLLLVLAHPDGISAEAAARHSGLSLVTALEKLRELRRRGEAGPDRLAGPGALWVPTDRVAAVRADLLERQRLRKLESDSRRMRRNKARREEAAVIDFCERPMVRRTVPACATPMPRVSGLRWIFDAGVAA